MKIKIIFFIFLSFISGCVTVEPGMTPLEIQSMQQRSYENSKNVVFSSVVSVFQDLGYTIKSADLNTGFISAESMSENDPMAQMLFGFSEVKNTRVTAYIETIGKLTNVRLNFVLSRQTSTQYGQTSKNERAILESNVYQNAFEKIENAIFIRSE